MSRVPASVAPVRAEVTRVRWTLRAQAKQLPELRGSWNLAVVVGFLAGVALCVGLFGLAASLAIVHVHP